MTAKFLITPVLSTRADKIGEMKTCQVALDHVELAHKVVSKTCQGKLGCVESF